MANKDKQSAGSNSRTHDTVTVDLPANAVDDLLEGMETAAWSSIRDIVRAIKHADAPIAVRSAAFESFTITVYMYHPFNYQRAYRVTSLTTIYDLAVAIEKTADVPMGHQSFRCAPKGGPVVWVTPAVMDEAVQTMQTLRMSEGSKVYLFNEEDEFA
ncbi:hypothetical protein PRZ48_008613 [Zasmidium cellare]|uniref:Uncharacterized protein n=1 Tax=Zasmidium cellare TaxID=395010 RepID=A0ABR0EG03_ZASCE|nr:hypothetical protein PRZ48_008613 [Zasmidium cellare]